MATGTTAMAVQTAAKSNGIGPNSPRPTRTPTTWTAVILEGVIEQNKNDREVNKKHREVRLTEMIPVLRKMFHDLDADGSGDVTLVELEEALEELKEGLLQFLNADSLVDLFAMLDIDGSGG